MHFFGTIGALMFILGLSLFTYMGIDKFYYLYIIEKPSPLLSDQAKFYLALTAMIIGTQLFLAGFVGELIGRNSSNRNNYKIAERI